MVRIKKRARGKKTFANVAYFDIFRLTFYFFFGIIMLQTKKTLEVK